MKILVTALFLIFTTAVWADVVQQRELTFAQKQAEEIESAGLYEYEKGNFTTAVSLFKKGAERGDLQSQFRLG